MFLLQDPLSKLPGIGEKTSAKIEKLGLFTIQDLLHHYPSRFLDLTHPTTIGRLEVKVFSSFVATLTEPKTFCTQSGKTITQSTAYDDTGVILLTWFNNPYIKKLIIPNTLFFIAGTPALFQSRLTIISPMLEMTNDEPLVNKGLLPIYPQTEGINSRFLRKVIKSALELSTISDPITANTRSKHSLINQREAYWNIHFPKNQVIGQTADRRLSFNEHLKINITNQLELSRLGDSLQIQSDPALFTSLKQRLPFTLTPGQLKVISKSFDIIGSKNPTHTLIQGDTGSGKTVVALALAIQTIGSGFSFCLLTPTQILADQHYETFCKYYPNPKIIQLVTGKSALKITDSPQIYIGTHALLNQLPENLKSPIAVLTIDEQHKFGVHQRDLLQKRRPVPHLFNLTATPIPRTLALGLFGEVNILNIYHQPPGRLPVKTWVVSNSRFKNSDNWLRYEIESGNKVFVVCPFIEDSTHQENIKSVLSTHKLYQEKFGSITKVHLIHGKLKPPEKTRLLDEFNRAKTGILVATPLIEVGIDITTANIMIIHSAERFGLAALHQLRGRVGRGNRQAFCLVIPSTDEDLEIDRLQLLTKYHSGLTLAKLDLKLRGTGDIAGTAQHGAFPTRLKYFFDKSLFKHAKHLALKTISNSPQSALHLLESLSKS